MSNVRRLLPLALLLPGAAWGTVVLEQTIEEMTSTSVAVVRGTVVRQQVRWDDGHRRIQTFTEIRATEHLKGATPDVFLVRSPGGELGRVGQRVEGAPAFAPGEDVLLFLEVPSDDRNVFIIAALAAGKVSLGPARDGQRHASRDLRGLARYGLGGVGPGAVLEGSQEDLGRADAFLARVRRAARSQ